jgi:Ca2+-binding EF-hand superfamily protein
MTTISSGVSSYTAGTGAMQRGGGAHRMQRGEGGLQDAQEAQGTPGPSLDELFSQIDTDGSGSISVDELKTAMQPRDGQTSAASDSSRNSDTSTSANSLSGMGLNTQDFASMMGGGMPPPPPPGGMGGPGGMPSLSSLDSDDDGSISMAEFGLSDDSSTASTEATASSASQDIQDLFKAIDGDSDGSLSQTEVQDFEKKLRALFESMQQMGSAASSTSGSDATSASASLSVMA